MADEETEQVSDSLRDDLLSVLEDALGADLLDSHIEAGRGLWIRVPVSAWKSTAAACSEIAGCSYFGFLSVIDWQVSEWGRSENAGVLEIDPKEIEKSDLVQGYAGGETRFQVFAYYYSLELKVGVVVKADLDDTHPEFETIREIFSGADWHEREAFEMFGVNVPGHPHLAKLYLPGDFEGYPMRKDFPLLAREVKPWPGLVDVEPIPEHLEAQLEQEILDAAKGGA